jgi:hypothetical protein
VSDDLDSNPETCVGRCSCYLSNPARYEHYATLVANLGPGERPPLLPGWRWRARSDPGALQAERPVNAQITSILRTPEQMIHDLVRIEQLTLERPISWGHVPGWKPGQRLQRLLANPDDPGAAAALAQLLDEHPELRKELRHWYGHEDQAATHLTQ